MAEQTFAGDKKAPMKSPLAALERRFIDANVDRFPQWMGSHHLTMLTVPWTLGVVAAAYGARQDLRWLWLSSLMLVLQWFTDSFDGALGRRRGAGLVKWGYYMDHFLDFMFMSGLLAGYTFLLQGTPRLLMILLVPLIGAFWVNAFLAFSVTNEFRITQLGLGPTEIRLIFVALNTAIIWRGPDLLAVVVPYLTAFVLIGLCLVVYRTHREVWAIDMAAKAAAADESGA